MRVALCDHAMGVEEVLRHLKLLDTLHIYTSRPSRNKNIVPSTSLLHLTPLYIFLIFSVFECAVRDLNILHTTSCFASSCD